MLQDTQASADHRQLVIQRVGIKDISYPVSIRLAGAVQPTVAQWTLDVALPADRKGTHMSRFVAWLDAIEAPLDAAFLKRGLCNMLDKLHADEGRIEARFPFFLRKRAPVTGVSSLLPYDAKLIAESRGGRTTLWQETVVPVKSLCPCSKEISDFGAHNQRSHVTIRIEVLQPLDWAEQVRFAEDSASAELWPLLKREDEKWVTEHAYENPKFVEDLVRDVAGKLNADARVGRYRVDVENFESIHAHSAFARIER